MYYEVCVILTGKKPTIAKLLLLKVADGHKIQIIDTVASKWKLLGHLMNFDDTGTWVDKADNKHRGDPDSCCVAIFKHWLNGNGRGPHTWKTLIELLEDTDYQVLADEVRSAIIR